MNSELFFDNKKYISVKKAATVTGYSSDYVGQLCRQNKINSKRVGRVWYVLEDSILNHKNFSNGVSGAKSSPEILSSDFKPSRLPEIAQNLHSKAFLTTETLLKSNLFLKQILPILLGLVLTVGLVSKKDDIMALGNRALNFLEPKTFLTHLSNFSKNISSAPNDAYKAVDEIADFYSEELKSKYLNIGGEILIAWQSPASYFTKTFRNLALQEKTFLDGKISLAKKLSASVFLSDLNPLEASGVFVYDKINNLFDRFIYSPVVAFFSPPEAATLGAGGTDASSPSVKELKNILTPSERVPLAPALNVSPKIVERVIERIITKAPEGLLTQATLDEQLQQLSNKLLSQMSVQFAGLSTGTGGAVTNIYQQIAQSQKIDSLTNTNINTPTITGGSINGTTVNASTISSGLALFNANVGIASTSPGYKLAVAGSGYFDGGTVTATDFVATSSLKLTSASGNSLLSTDSSGVVTATSTPTFGNFNATSTSATSTISTGGFAVGTNQFIVQSSSGSIGVATTTSWGGFAISNIAGQPAFVIGSSTGTSLIVDKNGNVGIGTSTPGAKFSFTGSGTGATRAFAVADSANVEKVTIFNNGRIGLGTTTPTATLDIIQNANGGTIISAFRATDTSPSGDFITYKSLAGTTLFRVDNSGNLLAGGIINSGSQTITSVSTPQFRVQYDSSNEWTASTNSIGSTTFATNGANSSLNFIPQNNQTQAFTFQNAAGAILLNLDTSNSRVGISSSTPGFKLSVSGSGYFDGGTVFASIVTATSTTGASTFPYASTTNITSTGYSAFATSGGLVGVGTTSPWGLLSLNPNALGTNAPSFVIGSSTDTKFIVANNG
ncbi:MAG: hypothetical protein HY451_01860, partial [Parcubacteria group bacterium]|nr:hypothetical protein [Parcubacteria group bacterium]